MTDEKFVFNETLKERNAAKSGAYHKKGGSKSRYCGLPSDHLTTAQLKAKSGEVKTYNLNVPMDYKTFKAVPDDLKAKYIYELRARYGAGKTQIADMLGVHANTVASALDDLHINFDTHRITKMQRYAWDAFLKKTESGTEECPGELPIMEAESVEKESASYDESSETGIAITLITLSGSKNEICQFLWENLADGRITVKAEVLLG